MTSNDYSIKSTSHLITIPHPPSPHFLVQILHLKDSLSINVFQSPNPISLPPGLLRSDQTSAKPTIHQASSKQNGTPDRDPTKDEGLDEELAKALAESGRIENEHGQSQGHGSLKDVQNSLPLARISKEWSVAMNPQVRNPKLHSQSSSTTSIFRTPSDISRPMSSRLSLKFKKPQLFLSLDLPESLLPNPYSQMSGNGLGSMEQSKGLLLLEKGISKAIEEGIEGH